MVKNKFLFSAAVFAMSFFATSCSDSERPEMKSSPNEPATSMQTAYNAEEAYYVCGPMSLMGGVTDFEIVPENKMELVSTEEGDEYYTLKKSWHLEEQDEYDFLVKTPSEGKPLTSKFTLTVEESDDYDVTFTYVPGDSFDAVAEKTEEPEPEGITITITELGYATFSNVKNVTMPEGLQAYTATYNETSSSMTLSLIVDCPIPAGNGVILKGEQGAYTLPVVDGELEDLQDNDLVATTSKDGNTPDRGTADMVLAKKDGVNEAIFMKLKDGKPFTSNCAYFPLDTYSENITVNSLSIKLQ